MTRRKVAGALTPCPCGRPGCLVKPGYKYGRKGCSLVAIPREVRVARARAWARAHVEECRANGRRGGNRARRRAWEDLLDRWLGTSGLDDPRGALEQCYKRGYSAGYLAGLRRAGVRRVSRATRAATIPSTAVVAVRERDDLHDIIDRDRVEAQNI